ncbi:C1q-related factor-like [Mizuhopecten yessoensis]|uniref:Complement C1q tumor necrosis factor-related protein 2 n=1 Tax=Mizuhopecten yessoensis TaxID=6573 RepID=A0A210PI67_MIZYE|nr:C1q-related factor-like [Mizuhopecten yessoensis]OWF36116.1 Complement C1q tumor necrosis factor-related protein 2 [Mizuhopecten yessoensis]
MSLQLLFVTLCFLSVSGNSLSADVGQTITAQYINELVEEYMANHLSALEAKYQSKFESLDKENALLKSGLISLKSAIEVLNHGDPSDEGDRNDTKMITNRPSLLSDDTRSYRVSTSNVQPQVAFQAVLDHTIGILGDYKTIKFNRIDLSLGNDYNANTGVFTCSVPGLYVFHTNIVNIKGKSLELDFLKNGNLFGRAYIGDEDTGRSESASSTAIVQLAVSDTVWLSTNTNHDSGDLLYPPYCYFSGYLLYPYIV